MAFIFLIHASVFSQKHDYNWTFGYGDSAINDEFGSMILDFNTNPPSLIKTDLKIDFDYCCAACSDSSGNLLFYTNGIQINNKEKKLMENGYHLNPGKVWDITKDNGYLGFGGMAVPAPGKQNGYYLFHLALALDSSILTLQPLYYTMLDMNANNSLGKVVSKNNILLDIAQTQQALVKHANGRDWWLLTAKMTEPIYYLWLVSPNGIEGPYEQTIGPDFTQPEEIGFSQFSPDGKLYFRNDLNSGLWIYDFDRCTGQLSNLRILPYSFPDFYFGNLSVSDDSRFLYLGKTRIIAQFDLATIDSTPAVDTIVLYDQFIDPLPIWKTTFGYPVLGADKKIYFASIAAASGRFHIVHHPELPAPSCDFEQHGLKLPRYNGATSCPAPNYRLGKMDGSPCDSIPGYAFPPKMNKGKAYKLIEITGFESLFQNRTNQPQEPIGGVNDQIWNRVNEILQRQKKQAEHSKINRQ